MISNIVDGLRLTKVFGGRADTNRLAALDAQIDALTVERTALQQSMRDNTRFEQVLPDMSSSNLHAQLWNNERVHRVSDVNELVRTRIGEPQDNKRCFARIVQEKKAGRFVGKGQHTVTAGIFTALIPVEKEGKATFSDIPGNIDGVVDLPVEAFQQPEKPDDTTVFAILYTISSKTDATWEQGGGRMLAEAVYAHLHAEAEERGYKLVISTLSPIRDFSKWYDAQPDMSDILEGKVVDPEFLQSLKDGGQESLDDMRRQVLRYLLLAKDPVANFHLGNGACVGDIKFNLDNPKDWVMVNYVYPDNVETLKAQQAYYKETKRRLLAPHLQRAIGYDADLQGWSTALLENPIEACDARWGETKLEQQPAVPVTAFVDEVAPGVPD